MPIASARMVTSRRGGDGRLVIQRCQLGGWTIWRALGLPGVPGLLGMGMRKLCAML